MAVRIRELWLDYGEAANADLLKNLSAVAVAGRFLWTASDEGRSVECLEPHRKGYRLHRQVALDPVFPGLPGLAEDAEADIESIDVAYGRLWVCGSHCRVRKQLSKTQTDKVDPEFRTRPSRHLLGSVPLSKGGGKLNGNSEALPFNGHGSLRHALKRNRYIEPFLHLPSKENGLDIEGMVTRKRRMFLGLRGPRVDSIAIVIELAIRGGRQVGIGGAVTHFLDLNGLGVRDLALLDGEIMVLAGPVGDAGGPFQLFSWRPRRSPKVQRPDCIYKWPSGKEKPEGICQLNRNRHRGVVVLYDSPDPDYRIKGSRYRADWISGL
jgi:uncharacterized protein DUF3616